MLHITPDQFPAQDFVVWTADEDLNLSWIEGRETQEDADLTYRAIRRNRDRGAPGFRNIASFGWFKVSEADRKHGHIALD